MLSLGCSRSGTKLSMEARTLQLTLRVLQSPGFHASLSAGVHKRFSSTIHIYTVSSKCGSPFCYHYFLIKCVRFNALINANAEASIISVLIPAPHVTPGVPSTSMPTYAHACEFEPT